MAHSTDGRYQASEMRDERRRPGTQREAMERILDECDPEWREPTGPVAVVYDAARLRQRDALASALFADAVKDRSADPEDVMMFCTADAIAAVAAADVLMTELTRPIGSLDSALLRIRSALGLEIPLRERGE